MTTPFELQKLDEEIARIPASPVTDHDFDRRATLMARRIELDQATRAARAAAAAAGRQPKGNIAVNVPPTIGLSNYFGRNGRVACSRVTDDGQLVLDLFLDEFRTLLMGANGLAWQASNPDVIHALGRP